MLIDYCNSVPLKRTNPRDLRQHQQLPMPPPRVKFEDVKPKSQLSLTVGSSKRDYNFRGKKPYTFLSAVEMEQFETDLKRGDLSKEELCEKYKVSISTTARFIRNFKEYGQLSVKKPNIASNDLVNKLKREYPQLTFAQINKKIEEIVNGLGQKQTAPSSANGTNGTKGAKGTNGGNGGNVNGGNGESRQK